MRNANGVWTAEEAALVLIDYQEEMFANVKSETTADEIELKVKFLIRAAKAFNIPVVLSSVGVEMGVNRPTRASIRDELSDRQVIDRSSMDAWEDGAFRAAVRGREVMGLTVISHCKGQGDRDARQAHHGSSGEQIQRLATRFEPRGGCSEGGNQREGGAAIGGPIGVAVTAAGAHMANTFRSLGNGLD